jgi:voltage-gated potassium channel Kch
VKKPDYRKLIISLIGLFVFYGVIVSLLHDIESQVPGSKMISWQDGLWYVVATITTVGYGDVYPVTYWGRAIGFVVMLSSLGVYGFIIGQIANFMSTLKEQRELGFNGTDFKDHVVIIGWNDFGRSVISHLVAAGKQVAVITRERSSIDAIREFYDTDKVYTLYDVAVFSEEILAYAHDETEYDIKQMRINETNSFVGTFYDKAFFDLKKSCNVILIGIVKKTGGEKKFIKNPDGSLTIEAGDHLVMMMDGKGKEALKKQFRIQET